MDTPPDSARGPGDLQTICGRSFLFTFFGGLLIMVTDTDFRAATRAREHGEPMDAVFGCTPIVFAVMLLLQSGLSFAVSIEPTPAWFHRHSPLLARILPGLLLILYITVFRPHG